MKDDPIVAEVRKIRRDILESYGWDFEKMSRDLMKKQWRSGHPVVSCPDKKAGVVCEPGAVYSTKTPKSGRKTK
jgi:hypothetical protein